MSIGSNNDGGGQPDEPGISELDALDQRKRLSIKTHSLRSRSELRLRLLDGYWTPLSNEFKRPMLSGWPEIEVTEQLIHSWDRQRKSETTGLRLDNGLIVFDWDIDDPAAIELYRDVLEEFPWLKASLRRTGKGNKEAWVLRCETEIRWAATSAFENPDPNNKPLRLEILSGSRRQIGAFGPHSEGIEYTWHLDQDGVPRSPETVPLADLNIISKRQVYEVVDWTQRWLEDAGFQPLTTGASGETISSHEYTITEDMVFDPDKSLDSRISYTELCAICPTRISGSWREGPSATNREKCIARFPDRHGGLSIHDYETGTTHHEKRFSPEEVERNMKEIGAALNALREQYGEPALCARRKPQKPELLVDMSNPDVTVEALGDILRECGSFYDRGGPARVVYDQSISRSVIQPLHYMGLIPIVHQHCRPVTWQKPSKAEIKNSDGGPKFKNAPLHKDLAKMYLAKTTPWNLPKLSGIASAPVLRDDGTILSIEGYDPDSGMFFENLPDTSGVPENPTRAEADAGLLIIREFFMTFPFADAETISDPALGARVVDLSKPPGSDETGCINALLTAVCRPSLHLAPAVLVNAPINSGAGTGKGKIARCISVIAFGEEPHAVTAGADAKEMDKRIVTEYREARSSLLLDNINNTVLRSDQLSSFITERPARARILGKSESFVIDAATFIILTGNALVLAEDLVRRFIIFRLDAHIEDPESRSFKTDPLAEAKERRVELLNAALTVWRWGRLNPKLSAGKPLGSFETWCRWVRDTLLALGCSDPVDRIREARENDPRRQDTMDFFLLWSGTHGENRMLSKDVAHELMQFLAPQALHQPSTRQLFTHRLNQLNGTRLGGFVFTCHPAEGKSKSKTYSLKKVDG